MLIVILKVELVVNLSKRLFNEVEKQKEPEIFYYRNHWEEKLENKDYREYVTHYDLQDYYEIIAIMIGIPIEQYF